MKYNRSQFTKLNYQMWELGLLIPTPAVTSVYSVKFRLTAFQQYSRITLNALNIDDALERACYAVTMKTSFRPEDVDLHAVYDQEENLLWVDESFYNIIQKKHEFRGMERREFLTLFGATTAAVLFGFRPSNAFAGTTVTPLSGTAGGFPGEQIYITAGSFTWTVPAGVTSANAVCVGAGGAGDDGNTGDGGGGGGGGGALVYANAFTVSPGASIAVVVGAGGTTGNGFGVRAQDGGYSAVTVGSFILRANGGQGGMSYNTVPGSTGGTTAISGVPGGVTTGGGAGGNGGSGFNGGGGGGGAGGYTGAGGNGSSSYTGSGSYNSTTPAGQGSGGGGGAGFAGSAGLNGGGSGGSGSDDRTGGGGGGANIYSSGNPATGGANGNNQMSSGSKGGDGGWPGGGGGGAYDTGYGLVASGGTGAVRIIWGSGRSFPNSAT